MGTVISPVIVPVISPAICAVIFLVTSATIFPTISPVNLRQNNIVLKKYEIVTVNSRQKGGYNCAIIVR